MSKVILGINDLKTLYPDIANEWHPFKNGDLLPEMIAGKSSKKVWWQCSKGHEWDAIVSNRTRLGRGCPYCAGQRVLVGETDLASVNPELANEWHPTKNAPLTPQDVTYGSKKEVWWQCKEGHEWKSVIKQRNYYHTKCPYCPNTITVNVIKGVNDFGSRYPELAKDWHPTKNGDLTPYDVAYASGKKAWWICKHGHSYKMIIGSKAKGRGCPICSRRRRTSFPEQAFYYYLKQAYPDAINSYKEIFKNGMELDIYIPSIKLGIEYDGKMFHRRKENLVRDSRKYKICKENGIQLVRIIDVNNQTPLITSDRKIVLIDTSEIILENAICELLYHLGKLEYVDVNLQRDRLKILEYLEKTDKNLATEFPEIAVEFHPTKNGNLTASHFHPGSNERVWWKCSKCNHEWKAGISDRTGADKNGCPKCAPFIGAKKHIETIIKEKGSLADTHPHLLELWNYERNDIQPTQVSAGSGKKVWWKCDKGHEWDNTIGHVANRSQRCPFCTNKRILQGYNDLATVNPKLALDWDYEKNGDMTPYNIGAGSGKKVWWKCSKCNHSWQTTITSRNSGAGCPNCDLQRKMGNQYAKKKK